ncbi:MAG: hypothetical protein MUO68_16050, partial [Desulfobacteraceae bacterium]|nr:hypothetical protein [Desulfobacteraceae bacterium]
EKYCGRTVFPYILQIGDGENGGVMMNEFARDFMRTYGEMDRERTVPLNGSEYLEFIKRIGVSDSDFMPVQPISQKRIWDSMDGFCGGAADRAIEKLKSKDPAFNLDKASWTNNMSWVRGYEDVLDPINKLSVEFHRRFDKRSVDSKNSDYKKALLYLLLSQTSCFRYWGSGIWTEYAKEVCRRAMEVLR